MNLTSLTFPAFRHFWHIFIANKFNFFRHYPWFVPRFSRVPFLPNGDDHRSPKLVLTQKIDSSYPNTGLYLCLLVYLGLKLISDTDSMKRQLRFIGVYFMWECHKCIQVYPSIVLRTSFKLHRSCDLSHQREWERGFSVNRERYF